MAGEPRDFGPYRLLRRLGVGGMAETFEATRIGAGGFEQRVCLKRVLPAFSEDQDFVSRFRREAKLAAQLRHSNIVGVVDFGEVDGVQYMTLELVDGVDLRSLLKSSSEERLIPETVALIGLDLAYALEHAHETLVHRDISPSNILLSRSGEAKLADFGIAKAIENTAATASRSAKGKVPYMSPEHMRGEAIDARADLFSLGVVLFEAAGGRRPFDGAHDVETMQNILNGERLSLAAVAPDAPAALVAIIEGLLETDPNARTASAAQLIDELALLAPAPKARRELAESVEHHRGGPQARMHVRARDEDPDTELSRPPELAPSMAGAAVTAEASPPPPHRKRAWVVASIVVAGLLAATLGRQWLDKEETLSVQESGAVPASASGPAPVPVPVPATQPAPATQPVPASATQPVPARPAKGWVHVIVQPWGNVWIDGTWMGRAPVKARLRKGRHVIEAGREIPARKRIVRVGAGSRKEIEINLPE